MTIYERRQILLDLLQKRPGLRVPEIAQVLEVSEGTVRNDLNAMEAEGLLMRVHGGAVLNEQPKNFNAAFNIRHKEHGVDKVAIAKKAAALVMDGDSLLLDSSSTVFYFAMQLAGRQRLRVMTNGIDVARLLAQNLTNTVILIGGVMNPDGSSVTGLLSEQIIADLHIQKAFVSCSGFSVNHGMTEVHFDEAQLKRKALESARQVFALVDSSKIGLEDLTSFARPMQISHLFTDTGLSEDWKVRLQSANISFTVCEPEVISA
ncbi:MAG: DeoR/GlpR family DNA-binding transcription regulator [Chloroflexi bacterium]|nr:DeoR/GlpR family DNA-binding transcription regulator [Chloroflexota bacterium]